MKSLFVGLLVFFMAFLPVLTSAQTVQGNKSNDQLASEYLTYIFTGKFDLAGKMVAPEALYLPPQGLPYGGTYKGFGEWTKLFMKMGSYFDLEMVASPQVFTSQEDSKKVMCSIKIKFTSRKKKKELTMDIIDVLIFENGKIIQMQPFYYDTKAVFELIQTDQSEN